MHNILSPLLVPVQRCSKSTRFFLKENPVWEKKAVALAEKTYELTQFIVDVLKVTDVGAKLEGKRPIIHPAI